MQGQLDTIMLAIGKQWPVGAKPDLFLLLPFNYDGSGMIGSILTKPESELNRHVISWISYSPCDLRG